MSDPDPPDEIEVDTDVLWAVAKERNRNVIRYFAETDRNHATLTDLAEYLAGRESDRVRNDPRDAEIHLHHSSLPQLDVLGIIDYDPDSGVVRQPDEPVLPADFMNHLLALDEDN